jgi:hypothetical protein
LEAVYRFPVRYLVNTVKYYSMKEQMQGKQVAENETANGLSRRKFLTYAGGLAGAGILIDACKKDKDQVIASGDVELGTGDIGLLNYFFAIEQLNAAFYSKVFEVKYTGMTGAESVLLTDIKNHEIAHREFLKNFIGSPAIGLLEFNFSGIDFTMRDAVLGAAMMFKEYTINAYNGAAALLVTQNNLLMTTKIASVEGRHAAIIRDLIVWGAFADTTDNNGADTGKSPQELLPVFQQYIKNKISGNNLPFN